MQELDPNGHYAFIKCKRSELSSKHLNDQGNEVDDDLMSFIDIVPSVGRVMFQENKKPVIIVDAAHTCYRNMLIISAVMQDGNGCLQSVAVSMCGNESEYTYTHFFNLLKRWVIPEGETPIIFSDRHKSIESAVNKVFEGRCTVHTCLVHLLRNVESWVTAEYGKNTAQTERRTQSLLAIKRKVTRLVDNYARATNDKDKVRYWKELEENFPEIVQHLNGIQTIWTRLQADEGAFGMITSNAVEVINSRMDRAVNLHYSIRDAHIVDMTIQIYSLIQSQVQNRFEKIRASIPDCNSEDYISPYVMKKINQHIASLYHNDIPTGKWTVKGDCVYMNTYNHEEFFIVDLKSHYCECGAWKILGYPCKHAVAYILFHLHRIHPSSCGRQPLRILGF